MQTKPKPQCLNRREKLLLRRFQELQDIDQDAILDLMRSWIAMYAGRLKAA